MILTWDRAVSSIHPQGWVPIETIVFTLDEDLRFPVAFTPKGGCPLKHRLVDRPADRLVE